MYIRQDEDRILASTGHAGSNVVGEEDRVRRPREENRSRWNQKILLHRGGGVGQRGKGCSHGCLEGYGVPTGTRTSMSGRSECQGCCALTLGGQEWELGEKQSQRDSGLGTLRSQAAKRGTVSHEPRKPIGRTT